ncbi:hypothetical protein BWZ22_05045 [Seonamhaeicola sp. S2-3]|nr:hypothetical protein BWZ22_05045 [Seonamhaeicola sp. S2-3]
MDYIEIIGLTAAVLTTSAFLPQVYKTWKTKDVSALSLPMLLIFFIGIVFWLVYGILEKSLSMILANAITIMSSFLLLYFKIKYGKRQ